MRRDLTAVMASSAVLGVVYTAVVPRGLPYDEPSHWANVLFYVRNLSIPRLGDAGVTYEAQMGPVAYVLDAVVAAPLRLLSDPAALYGVRILGVLEHMVLTWLVWRLVGRALPGRRPAAVVGALAVGVNPMLLAMSASVQNDTLALVLAAAAIDVATGKEVDVRRGALCGGLVGLALLTKVTMWPVAVVLGLRLLVRREFAAGACYGVSAFVVFGWWLLRNVSLYGDLTGRAGVEAAGYDFPALQDTGPVDLARSAITYLWLPTEYVRNTVVAPSLIDALVVLLTLCGCVGVALSLWSRHDTRRDLVLLLGATALVAVVGWLVTSLTTQAVAFRFAYAALFAWFTGIGALVLVRIGRQLAVGVVVGLVVLNAWFLWSVGGLTVDFGL
jgi:hypothetical protein